MTETIIRQVQGDELLDVLYWLPEYAFRSSPPMIDKAERAESLRQRVGMTCFAAFRDGSAIACANSNPMRQQVRGAIYGMAGFSHVTTHPAARRQGHAKRLLARLLAAVREEGRAFSCLWPFRELFYERLGWVTFPQMRIARFVPSALVPLLERDLGGEVELTLLSQDYDRYREYVLTHQHRVHGMAVFEYVNRYGLERNDRWLALAKVNGEIVGLMTYELRGERIAEFLMRISRFYYSNAQGQYLLLAWIARHAEQANRTEITLAPSELPETWLADIRVATESTSSAAMGRVVDVAQLSGMRVGTGRFAVRITDPLCPWNEGFWQFEAVDGALRVSKASHADCELSIQALTGLIYGTHAPGTYAYRGWGNPSPQVQETMRIVFPPMLPCLHEGF